MQYKALSLLQPWASLVAMGAKQIETRSWNTKHRGLLLIHASKGQKVGFDFCLQNEPSIQSLLTFKSLPFGAIIGCVKLEGVHKSETFFCQPEEPSRGKWIQIGEQEKAFGDYSPGRYGWLLSEPVMFNQPIPCKGSLGLWTPDERTSQLVDLARLANATPLIPFNEQ